MLWWHPDYYYCLEDFTFLANKVFMCGSTWDLVWDGPGAGPGDQARARCRSSFCGNVVMGRDSWQLCFLSARILCDISNKCHGGAMSTVAQQTHEGILMCFHSFSSPVLLTYPNLSWFRLPSPLYHCLCSHLTVLLCILIFSSRTNAFASIFGRILSCLNTLNEAYQQEHGPGSDSGSYFQESGGIFSNEFHRVPIVLHNYDSPMQMHRPTFLYIKKEEKEICSI